MLRVNAVRGSKSLDFDPIKLADGVIATSTLIQPHARAIMMKDKFVRITPETQMADINYVINRYDIRPAELKAEDIVAFKEYIKAVETDPNREFKTTKISSYASPDGQFTLNQKLLR